MLDFSQRGNAQTMSFCSSCTCGDCKEVGGGIRTFKPALSPLVALGENDTLQSDEEEEKKTTTAEEEDEEEDGGDGSNGGAIIGAAASDYDEKADEFEEEDDDDDDDPILSATYIAEADLPTDIGLFRLRAYRIVGEGETLQENNISAGVDNQLIHPPSAIMGLGSEPCLIFSADKPPPFGSREYPVRVHDQCFTSEVFRSQRCDCKDQLKLALSHIHENGGAVIYLQQEGRGIGLANKVAAYSLQDRGLDTVDANIQLGLPADARRYGVIPSILNDVGIDSIRLMTNNPRKVRRLRKVGVHVEGTIPMVALGALNDYNRGYLETKVDRMGHANLESMLLSESELESESPQQGSSIRDLNEFSRGAESITNCGIHGVDCDGYRFGRQAVEDAIAAVAKGELIVVVDDGKGESNYNEGDFIMAANKCTPKRMAECIRYSSGVTCVGMEGKTMNELGLSAAVAEDTEDSDEAMFGIPVDAVREHGVKRGISATDRAMTVTLLASRDAKASDFRRPGHVFPRRAQENGVVTTSSGNNAATTTDAAVDFARMAGSSPAVGLISCGILSEENPVEMAGVPELKSFCKRQGYVLTSVNDLRRYRLDTGLGCK